jgi:uncharacterized membrane protein YhhN
MANEKQEGFMLMVFMALFAGMSAAHLVSLFFQKRNIQALTKIFLLPLLLAVYVFGAEKLFAPVLFALIFGWGGDALLLKINEPRFFRLGLASFLIGHLCYIPSFVYGTESLNMAALVIFIVVAVPLGFFIHAIIKPGKAMNLPVVAYEVIILLMSLSALQLFLSRRDHWSLLIFAGSLCFLLSDTLLACFTFRTKPKYGDFWVMLAYIAAQSGIVRGMMEI